MVTINQDACTGCGRCIKDCIAGTISLQDHKARSAGSCLLCGHCVAVCPTGAVSIPEYDMKDVEELIVIFFFRDTATIFPRKTNATYANLDISSGH